MNALNQNSFIFLRKILSSVVFLLFLLQISYLYLNTLPSDFDSLESIKIIGPVSILLIFTVLNRPVQGLFIKFMVFVLYMHIIIALIYLAFNFSGSMTNISVRIEPGAIGGWVDNRLVLPLLGRSPGGAAHIFCVALVVNDFYLKNRSYVFNNFRKITNIFFITIILLTQARSYYLFLIIYFLINYWRLFFYIIKSFKAYMIIIWISGILYFSEIKLSFFERTLNNLFSGRDYIWNAFLNDYFNRDETSIFFGSDLSRHEIIINEINYTTSDVHNTFFDVMNYYGMVPVFIFSCWYLFSSGFFLAKKSFVILAAYFPVLIFTAVFKYPFAFYSSLLLLLLPIYFSNSRRP